MSKSREWLGRNNPNGYTAETLERWCRVNAGDPLLTRRANSITDGVDLMRTVEWSPLRRGPGIATSQVGRYVRHSDYAEALDRGRPAEMRRAASAAMTGSEIHPVDRLALILSASPRLAAEMLNLLSVLDGGQLKEAVTGALATGGNRARLRRRAAMVTGLAASARLAAVTAEEIAAWDALPVRTSVSRVRYGVAAGYTPAQAAAEPLSAIKILATLRHQPVAA